jgi:hypothetical protein
MGSLLEAGGINCEMGWSRLGVEELGHLLYMFPFVFKVGGDEVANVMHAEWFHTHF